MASARIGGLGGAFRQQVVSLTNAQVLALPTTPVEIVPSPGVGYSLIPVVMTIYQNFQSAVVAGAGNSIQLMYGSGISHPASRILNVALGLTNPRVYLLSFPQSFVGVGGAFDAHVVDYDPGTGVYQDTGLYLNDYFGGVSDYTGGHANNVFRVTLMYLKLQLATGNFA